MYLQLRVISPRMVWIGRWRTVTLWEVTLLRYVGSQGRIEWERTEEATKYEEVVRPWSHRTVTIVPWTKTQTPRPPKKSRALSQDPQAPPHPYSWSGDECQVTNEILQSRQRCGLGFKLSVFKGTFKPKVIYTRNVRNSGISCILALTFSISVAGILQSFGDFIPSSCMSCTSWKPIDRWPRSRFNTRFCANSLVSCHRSLYEI
jgi:hypothetical protein